MGEESLELGLKLPVPVVKPELVNALLRVLRQEKRWMTAIELAGCIGGTNDRLIRKAASAAAPSVVSWPGSPGYKAWEHCTVDEINHAMDAFGAQITDMIKRLNLYRSAYYRRFRGEGR